MSVTGYTQGSPSTISSATSSSHQPEKKQLKVAEATGSEGGSVKVLTDSTDEDLEPPPGLLPLETAVPNVPAQCSERKEEEGESHDADLFVPNGDRQRALEVFNTAKEEKEKMKH